MSEPLLMAIARAILARCPHTLGYSEAWRTDPATGWKVIREPCEACAALAALLRLGPEPVVPVVATEKG